MLVDRENQSILITYVKFYIDHTLHLMPWNNDNNIIIVILDATVKID